MSPIVVTPIAGSLGSLNGVFSAGLKNSGGRSLHHNQIGGMKVTAGETADSYEAVHPIVRTVEETGQKAIYCSKVHTTHFEGMTGDESQPLIDWLLSHATRPEFTCRVHWEPRTLTVWDNRRVMHNAINDYHGMRRHMRRLTSGPSISVRSRAIAYDLVPSSRAERSEAEGPLLSTLHPAAAEQKRSLDFVRFAHAARDDGDFYPNAIALP